MKKMDSYSEPDKIFAVVLRKSTSSEYWSNQTNSHEILIELQNYFKTEEMKSNSLKPKYNY